MEHLIPVWTLFTKLTLNLKKKGTLKCVSDTVQHLNDVNNFLTEASWANAKASSAAAH